MPRRLMRVIRRSSSSTSVWIEPRRRLIHRDDDRIHGERPRDLNEPLMAEGQRIRGGMTIAAVADEIEQLTVRRRGASPPRAAAAG